MLVSKAATEAFGDLSAVYNVWTQVICATLLIAAVLIYRYLIFYPLYDGYLDLWAQTLISVLYFLFFVCICAFVIVPFLGPVLAASTGTSSTSFNTVVVGKSNEFSTQAVVCYGIAACVIAYFTVKLAQSCS